MGKNKLLALALVIVTTICLAVGVTYSWFVDKAKVTEVNVSTGLISICLTPLIGDYNKLPGESVWVNPLDGLILNKGTRNAIIELSFDGNISAQLATGQFPEAKFAADYINTAGVWNFGPTRLSKVASMEMKDGTYEANGWVKIGNKYYGLIKVSNVIAPGKIYLNIKNELGGLYKDPDNSFIQSDSRQFEQGTIFHVSYTITGVQATKQAIVDNFGSTVANTVPSNWYDPQ